MDDDNLEDLAAITAYMESIGIRKPNKSDVIRYALWLAAQYIQQLTAQHKQDEQ